MKIEELRLNNYVMVRYGGALVLLARVIGLHQNGLVKVLLPSGEEAHTTIDALISIPITPEWLGKFRFENKRTNIFEYPFVKIVFNKGTENITIIVINDGWDNIVSISVKNGIHQLQNICTDLGVELKGG